MLGRGCARLRAVRCAAAALGRRPLSLLACARVLSAPAARPNRWSRAPCALFHSSGVQRDEKRDFYEVLGLPRTATKQEIKKKYFELAKKYHPDKNPNDKDAQKRFVEVTGAYEVLSDDQKRKMYDQFGHSGVDASAGFSGEGGMGGFGGMSAEDIFREFSSMFGGEMSGGHGGGPGGGSQSDFFGFGRGPSRNAPSRGSDINHTVTLPFMDGIKGCERDITVSRQCTCSVCNGTGAKPGTKAQSCPTCRGSGFEEVSTGFFAMRTTCRRCHGEGNVLSHPCRDCGGEGTVRQQRTIQVTVPPGVDTGDTLRLSGQGNAGRMGGPPGHLFVQIRVSPDSFFRRDGQDLHTQIPISVSQAVLGAKIKIPTIDGEEEISVSAGTQPGDVFSLRSKGVPRSSGFGRGSQVIHFDVKIPKHTTEKQKELMREFGQEEMEHIDTSRASPFSSLRDVVNRFRCVWGSDKKGSNAREEKREKKEKEKEKK